MDIVDHIISQVKEQGVKQKVLAEKAGLSKVKMSRFMNRQGDLWSNELMEILKILRFRVLDPNGKEIISPRIRMANDPEPIENGQEAGQ